MFRCQTARLPVMPCTITTSGPSPTDWWWILTPLLRTVFGMSARGSFDVSERAQARDVARLLVGVQRNLRRRSGDGRLRLAPRGRARRGGGPLLGVEDLHPPP